MLLILITTITVIVDIQANLMVRTKASVLRNVLDTNKNF